MSTVGVFPGSFDPFTIAHLAIAEAAVEAFDLDRLDLCLSHRPLAKEHRDQDPIDARVATILDRLGDRTRIGTTVTRFRLLADIAAGYDVLVIGADKWHQLHDVSFYGSRDAMADALARLPRLAVVPRADITVPGDVPLLHIDPRLRDVSSSAVRAGQEHWRA